MTPEWTTPFEQGNGNQTTTWQACIQFHQRLAEHCPAWLRFEPVGLSDGGVPIHLAGTSSHARSAQAQYQAARERSFPPRTSCSQRAEPGDTHARPTPS